MVASGRILLAGVEGGGVYASTDNGAEWKRTNAGLTTTSVHTLVLNGARLFAGTDSGVFVSTNDGAWWTRTGLKVGPVNALAVKGLEIFAGTDDGVFCSSDNGDNWAAPGDSGLTYRVIHALATTGTTLVAGAHVGGWGGIFVSTNNGASWTQVNDGWTNCFIGLGSNLLAGTSGGGVSLSSNNGSTWIQTGLKSGHVSCFAAIGTHLFAGCSFGGGVFRSIDSGASWTGVNNGFADTSIYALAASGGDLFVATADGIYVSHDEGAGWTKSAVIGNPNVHVTALANKGPELFAGASWGFCKGLPKPATGTERNSVGLPLSGCLYHSTDNGDSWQPLLRKFVWCCTISGEEVFVGAGGLVDDYGGIVYHTTDNGLSWSRDSIGTIGNVEALATSPDGSGGKNLFAGTSGDGVFLSTNNGTSWAAVNAGLPHDPQYTSGYPTVSAFAVIGAELFVATLERGVFRSTNSGTRWTAINAGLTDTSVTSLVASGANLFAATRGGGVFLSTDDGTTWAAANSGLPTGAIVSSLAVSGLNLFASTCPDGVFLSTNNGTTWESIASGLPPNSPGWIGDKAGPLAVTPGYVFVGTGHSGGYTGYGSAGAGVWRRPLSEVVSVEPRSSGLPGVAALAQNYPNPFNPGTIIKYELFTPAIVRLSVYDVLGREVSVLVNERKDPGSHEIAFDAGGLSSGVYFYRMTVGNFMQAKKLEIVK
jgi:ligand-binding sensor domain-containing protein